MIESLLLTTARVSTFFGTKALTGASGFFFQRDQRLYFVTNRHVLTERPSGHRPDRIEIEIEVHTNADSLTHAAVLSVLLYRDGQAIWHQGRDSAGDIDVAAIELDRGAIPAAVMLRAFTPAHLQHRLQEVKVGTPLLVMGFPLGFHNTLHHRPVVRQVVIASSFGLHFQGQGYFLTDARTHRGTSGAPVVMHDEAGDAQLPWKAAVHERQPGQRPVIHVERTELTKRRVSALADFRDSAARSRGSAFRVDELACADQAGGLELRC